MKQLKLIKDQPKAYGGELLKTRKGRQGGRPLDTRNSMHLVLRSSKAKGEWSFLRPQNRRRISQITDRFCRKYGVRLISLANVGNHLHMQIQLSNLHTYRPFIRGMTAAIAMAVTGVSRWRATGSAMAGKSWNGIGGFGKSRAAGEPRRRLHFWDYRPFTRVIQGFRGFLNLRDYIRINQLEGYGYRRGLAEMIVKGALPPRWSSA